MIIKFNQYIKEGLIDKMAPKSFDDLFTYDNFKTILRDFKDGKNEHKDLDILEETFPLLIESDPKDLKYFVIKYNAFTGDNNGEMIYAKDYIDLLYDYTKGVKPKKIDIPGLTSGMIEKVLVFKNKKVIKIIATYGTMFVLDKNIFSK